MAAIKKQKLARKTEAEKLAIEPRTQDKIWEAYYRTNWNKEKNKKWLGGTYETAPMLPEFNLPKMQGGHPNEGLFRARRYELENGHPPSVMNTEPVIATNDLPDYYKHFIETDSKCPYYEDQNRNYQDGKCGAIAFANAANLKISRGRLKHHQDNYWDLEKEKAKKLPDYTFPVGDSVAYAPSKFLNNWSNVQSVNPDIDLSKRGILRFHVNDDPRMRKLNDEDERASHQIFFDNYIAWDPNEEYGYHVLDEFSTPVRSLAGGYRGQNNGHAGVQLVAQSDIPKTFLPMSERPEDKTGWGFKGLARKWKRKQFMNGQGYGRKK